MHHDKSTFIIFFFFFAKCLYANVTMRDFTRERCVYIYKVAHNREFEM